MFRNTQFRRVSGLSRSLFLAFLALFVAGSFFAGLAVGAWKIGPYNGLEAAWRWLSGTEKTQSLPDELRVVEEESFAGFDWEKDVLLDAFATSKVIDGPLYYGPIEDVSGIRAANMSLFVPVETFENAYEEVSFETWDQLPGGPETLPVVRVTYNFAGDTREAFAYGKIPVSCSDGGGLGSLIVPGSGENQSSTIYLGDSENYHYGVMDRLPSEGSSSRYVLIKPNEDFLAFHNGSGQKLRLEYILDWQLNRGGSYSVSYMLDSLAFTKALKQCFSETAVVGISQGGAAAMLISLQAEPSAVVVASGHSFLFRSVLPSSPTQIRGVPGYYALFREDVLWRQLDESRSKWLFSWGLLEPGIYGEEARGGPTYSLLGMLPNVTVCGHLNPHAEGHSFPEFDIIVSPETGRVEGVECRM